MKRTNIFLTVLLLWLGLGARADNVVAIGSAEGAPDEEVTVSIGLTNTDAVAALQVNIPLDDELTFVSGSAALGSRSNRHSVTAGVKDGVLNIMVYNLSLAAFTGNNGEVVNFRLKLGNQPADITLTTSKLILTDTNGNSVDGRTESGSISIRCAKAQYSTMTVDFGSVPIRSTYNQTVTITNVGNEPLTVTGLQFNTYPTDFSSLTVFPLTIEAGSSAEIDITYAPQERGCVSETVKVACNSISKLNNITLKAQPFAVNELRIQPTEGVADETVTVAMTMNNMDDVSGFQLEFTLPQELTFVPNSFMLTARKQDHTLVQTEANGVVRIICYSPSDTPFTGNDGELATMQFKLSGRNSPWLEASKCLLTATIKNQVTNVCSASYGTTITILSPQINADGTLDMGATPVTEDAVSEVYVGNTGNAPLTISRVVFDKEGFFVREEIPMTIEPWAGTTLTVVYPSIEEGDFSTTMQLYSNDPEQRLWNVNVTGNRFAPNYLNFTAHDVAPNQDVEIDVAMSNYDAINGLQFDMEYPSAYYEPTNSLVTTARAAGYSVSQRSISTNIVRYFFYLFNDTEIAPGEGKVFSFKLHSKGQTPEGSYTLNITNIKLGTAEMVNKYAGTDMSFTFSVDGTLTGDVSGDIGIDPVTVTANSYTIAYGDAIPEFGYTSSGATLDGTPTISCIATSASPVGTYPIVISKGSVANYNDSYVNGVLTITKAPLTIAAGTYTKKQGEENPEFVLSYEGFKNNETKDVLTKQAKVVCEAIASSAPGEYPVTVSSAEAQNYEISYINGKLIVTDADPVTVTANSYTIAYGDAIPEFGYTSSGATLDGTPTISCEATSASPVGTYPIVISKGSVTNYNDSYVNGVLTITKAPLTIAAGTYTKKQGEENPEFVLSYEGFKNNETKDVLTKQAKVVCEAIASSAPGEYAVTVSGAEAQNYEISYVSGKLIVTDADPVTVTANSYTIAYGDAIPELGYASSGATLNGTPTISCEATSTSPVGTYPIVISKGSVTNYNDSYVNGVLTITKAPLTIAAGTYTKKQGEENPEFTLTYDGFKNNETEDVLTTKPTATTSATVSSEPGEYEIVVSGGEAQNYELSYMNGKLTITDADPIKLTAKSYTREYGEANPVFEFTVEGAALDGEPEIICEATATSPVGEYPIIIRKGSVKNHNDSYVNGTLTITKAPLTVSVGNYTRKQGEANPDFFLSYDGFKNNETEDVLTTKPTATTSAIVSSEPGEYEIVVSGGEAQNYEISYVSGKLIVTDADPIKLTAKSYTRKYGESNPVFEFTVEGAALDGEPEIICEATATSPVGEYPIIIKKGSVKNYNDSYVNGTLSITKAPLTVSVGNYTKKQYDPMPEFSVTYDGFKNNETKDVLTKQPEVNCEANEDSAPGEYPIVVSGAEAVNYQIQYIAGKLTVTEPDSYTLTYIVDGEVYQNFIIKYRDRIAPLEAPTKEGYTFSGWSEIPETMPAHDVIVTGNFIINQYTLAYIIDGKEYKSYKIDYNAVIVPISAPVKKGMTFSGWSEIPERMPAHDVTITGTYSWLEETIDYVIYQVTDTLNNYASVIGNENIAGKVEILSTVEIGGDIYTINCIGRDAFAGCSGMTSITIPESVVSIGCAAFEGCTSLQEIYCNAEQTPEVESDAFDNVDVSFVMLVVPDNSAEEYKAHPVWGLFWIETPTSIREIESLTPALSKGEGGWYDLSGRKIDEPRKGINIIRYSDGTSKKVLVK